MKQVRKFVGLDVYKDTIAVAVSEANGGQPCTMVKFQTCQKSDGQVGQDLDRPAGRRVVF